MGRIRFALIVILGALVIGVIGLASCASYQLDKSHESLMLTVTAQAQPTEKPTQPPEANPAFIALTMLSNQAQAAATQQALDLARNNALTAEALTAEAKAAQATAESDRIRATLQAQYFELTQSAASLTQIADSSRSTQSAQYTATARPIQQTLEAGAAYAQMTQQAAGAIEVYLSVQRQQKKNMLDALGPWSLIIIGVIFAALFFWVGSRTRTLKPGELFIERKGKATAIVAPHNIATAGIVITQAGEIADARGDVSSDNQSNVTRRAQIADMVKGKTLPETRSILSLIAGGSPAGGEPRFFKPAGELIDSLDQAENQIIDGDLNP